MKSSSHTGRAGQHSCRLKFFVAYFVFLGGVLLHAADIPAGFREQALQPLEGRVLMPEKWQFKGGSTPSGYLYTFAEKFRDDGSYDTGFRIQVVMKVKELSKDHTPAQEAVRVREQFKSDAIRILDECKPEEAGPFQKFCLETINANASNPQDEFHILYTFFWSDDLDMLVVTIFGAPASQWKSAYEIYGVMRGFALIDVKKIEEKAEAMKHINRADVLGSWSYSDPGGMISTLILSADGTFSSRITQGDETPGEFSGSWTLDEGNELNSEYLQSSSPKIPVGTKDKDVIQELTPDHVDFLSRDGKIRRYLRDQPSSP